MFAERESHAVYFLQKQNMTRFDAANYISHGIAKAPGFSGAAAGHARDHAGGPGAGDRGRDWGIRDSMAAPHGASGWMGWAMQGPVQHFKGRLAFLKAELDISGAQDQLWEVFAEAIRDFLKARPRPNIEGPVRPSGLPERLAMRERNLASELESLRNEKAIIETFYAGLSEEQRRRADQLLAQLFGF
jgi:hypothetical protein